MIKSENIVSSAHKKIHAKHKN